MLVEIKNHGFKIYNLKFTIWNLVTRNYLIVYFLELITSSTFAMQQYPIALINSHQLYWRNAVLLTTQNSNIESLKEFGIICQTLNGLKDGLYRLTDLKDRYLEITNKNTHDFKNEFYNILIDSKRLLKCT